MSDRQYRPNDDTNPPHHRPEGKQECIDAMPKEMIRWLDEQGIDRRNTTPHVKLMMLGFCVGNAFKYRYRKGRKEGEPEDLEEGKARWYDEMGLHLLNDKNPDPRDNQ